MVVGNLAYLYSSLDFAEDLNDIAEEWGFAKLVAVFPLAQFVEYYGLYAVLRLTGDEDLVTRQGTASLSPAPQPAVTMMAQQLQEQHHQYPADVSAAAVAGAATTGRVTYNANLPMQPECNGDGVIVCLLVLQAAFGLVKVVLRYRYMMFWNRRRFVESPESCGERLRAFAVTVGHGVAWNVATLLVAVLPAAVAFVLCYLFYLSFDLSCAQLYQYAFVVNTNTDSGLPHLLTLVYLVLTLVTDVAFLRMREQRIPTDPGIRDGKVELETSHASSDGYGGYGGSLDSELDAFNKITNEESTFRTPTKMRLSGRDSISPQLKKMKQQQQQQQRQATPTSPEVIVEAVDDERVNRTFTV
eukprot:TRINITY_DN67030_c7_g1_i1.p1 TRINITY_DN67030_c7_g1~~TRINITY_DN67030_c7_g1_i1.p1  ORF type:complete len:357 (-),score=203.44 TRINITY_DN67030_c7_g1_i1:59-1129(-)